MPEEPKRDGGEASHYANAFEISFGNSDFTLDFRRNGRFELRLNLSYTVAKTLAEQLAMAVVRLESITDHKIMTALDIGRKFKEAPHAPNDPE
jgi:hypothetical protein